MEYLFAKHGSTLGHWHLFAKGFGKTGMVSPKACCRAGNRNESHLKEYVKWWFYLAWFSHNWIMIPTTVWKKEAMWSGIQLFLGLNCLYRSFVSFLFSLQLGAYRTWHRSKGELHFHNYWVMVINHQSIFTGIYIYIWMNEWMTSPSTGGHI
jgi:hypothetical protein